MEKKKVQPIIPWNVLFRDYLFWAQVIILVIFVMVIPIYFLPNPIYPAYEQFVNWIFVLLFGISFVLMAADYLRRGQTAVYKWIVENARCPACNGRIKSCVSTTYPAGMYLPLPRDYIIQCSQCNKKFLLGDTSLFSVFGRKPEFYEGEWTDNSRQRWLIGILIFLAAIVAFIILILLHVFVH